ncbi:MAG: NACHT domain-containing protein, partial [Anaerolineales bacterium]|nr:NACHT domain-containing protein [Anaerolineales bacterium]
MPTLDPQTIETISQAAQILWETFGKEFVQKVLKRGSDEVNWRRSVEKYYTSLYEYAGFVHVLGKMESEKLEEIFTDVNVLDKILAEQRYSLDHMREHFGPRAFRYSDKVKRQPGLDVLHSHNKLFILGKPGAGKTTFLKWAALQAIRREINYFPIFVALKTLSDSKPGLRTGDEVLDYIVRLCRVHQIPEPRQFIERLLQDNKCMVLFDGLDEVNVENRQRDLLIDGLNEFVTQYGGGKVLITCRVAANDYSFTQFDYVEMADFSREQIGAFIDKWFSYDKDLAERCKNELLKDNQNQALLELAQIPLLLTLLCLTYEERFEFPPNRSEIYEEATRALLVKWDSSRKIRRDPAVYKELTLRHKQKLFAFTAYQTFLAGDYFLSQKQLVPQIEAYLVNVPGVSEPDGEAVLQAIEAQHGIFVERARRIHSFSHLTLQEYYTANFIVANEARRSLANLMAYVEDNRWREVFLLVAGMLEDGGLFFRLFAEALDKIGSEDMALKALLKGVETVRPAKLNEFNPFEARLLLISWALDYESINALQGIY